MDICIAIFDRYYRKTEPNKRGCVWLKLKELTRQEKFYNENKVIMYALQGNVPISLVRTIEFDDIPEPEPECKMGYSKRSMMIEEKK